MSLEQKESKAEVRGVIKMSASCQSKAYFSNFYSFLLSIIKRYKSKPVLKLFHARDRDITKVDHVET